MAGNAGEGGYWLALLWIARYYFGYGFLFMTVLIIVRCIIRAMAGLERDTVFVEEYVRKNNIDLNDCRPYYSDRYKKLHEHLEELTNG
jgi:hypothetical protein